MRVIRVFSVIILLVLFAINTYCNDCCYDNVVNAMSLLSCRQNKYGDYNVSCDQVDSIIKNLNALVVNKKEVSDRVVIEAYSPLINDYVIVNNIKINIQISIADENCILGIPLIKNSF